MDCTSGRSLHVCIHGAAEKHPVTDHVESKNASLLLRVTAPDANFLPRDAFTTHNHSAIVSHTPVLRLNIRTNRTGFRHSCYFRFILYCVILTYKRNQAYPKQIRQWRLTSIHTYRSYVYTPRDIPLTAHL